MEQKKKNVETIKQSAKRFFWIGGILAVCAASATIFGLINVIKMGWLLAIAVFFVLIGFYRLHKYWKVRESLIRGY